MGKRGLVALLSLSSWCLVIVVWLFFAVPWVCLQSVIVVFPDHTHLLFCSSKWVIVIRHLPSTYSKNSKLTASIVQLVERPISKREVVGSNPVAAPDDTKSVKMVLAAPLMTLAYKGVVLGR